MSWHCSFLCQGVAGNLDIVYAIDGSQTVSSEAFMAMKSFVNAALSANEISPEKTHVGLLVYGRSSPKLDLLLNRGTSADIVKQTLSEMVRRGGKREIDKALLAVKDEFLSSSKRKDVGKLAVLLTNGNDESENKQGVEKANAMLKKDNVKLVVINIGKPVEMKDLPGVDELKNVETANDLPNTVGYIEQAMARSMGK